MNIFCAAQGLFSLTSDNNKWHFSYQSEISGLGISAYTNVTTLLSVCVLEEVPKIEAIEENSALHPIRSVHVFPLEYVVGNLIWGTDRQ